VTVELIAKQNRKLNYKKPRIEGQKFFLKKVNLKEQKKNDFNKLILVVTWLVQRLGVGQIFYPKKIVKATLGFLHKQKKFETRVIEFNKFD
jgi:hypothetical protein